jgi:hypothetical protein
MTVVTILWLGIEVLGILDALRRSDSEWRHADRDRPFWVVFMFFLGPIAVAPYLMFVWPRFPGRATREKSNTFLKR